MSTPPPIALTIAGSDSSGGAGIQADLKTFAAHQVYGASVIVALTAQNTTGVRAIHAVPAEFVAQQLDAVFEDLDVAAVKIGMLATAELIETVAAGLIRHKARNIVLDPVMVAASGAKLLQDDAVDAIRRHLFPLATLGPIADFAARAGFARGLFEAGGLSAPSGEGFAEDGATDVAALVAAFTASGARLACLCGSDAAYAAEASTAAQALTAAGATVWLAGRPGELEVELNKAGVSRFIYAGGDVIEALTHAHDVAAA